MPVLTLNFKNKSIGQYRLQKGESLTIGRRDDNEIVLDDPAVSGHHAKVDSLGDRFVLIDLKSKNGTFVNEQLIESHWLNDGDAIAIGGHALILDYSEDECAAVGHCIHAHKGKAEHPRTIEAQILYDADVLEKAGLVFLIWGGKVISEFNESIHHFLQREITDRGAELARGLYTRKARELDGGRLEKVQSMFLQVRREITEDRPDYEITEDDLWRNAPP